MKYSVVFEKSKTGWSAYPPDLPGVGVAGRTFARTRKLIEEAIQFHIEGLKKDGEPVPRPTSKLGYVSIAPEQNRGRKQAARARNGMRRKAIAG